MNSTNNNLKTYQKDFTFAASLGDVPFKLFTINLQITVANGIKLQPKLFKEYILIHGKYERVKKITYLTINACRSCRKCLWIKFKYMDRLILSLISWLPSVALVTARPRDITSRIILGITDLAVGYAPLKLQKPLLYFLTQYLSVIRTVTFLVRKLQY